MFEPEEYIGPLIFLGMAVLVIISVLIFLQKKAKRHYKQKKEMLEDLQKAEYHFLSRIEATVEIKTFLFYKLFNCTADLYIIQKGLILDFSKADDEISITQLTLGPIGNTNRIKGPVRIAEITYFEIDALGCITVHFPTKLQKKVQISILTSMTPSKVKEIFGHYGFQ